MNREQANTLLKNIIKDYRENYDGDYFMYECVDRDILTAVAEAFDRGELTEVEFKDLSNYVLSDYLKSICKTVCSKPETSNSKIHLKVENMSLNELRIEIEDKFSKLEDAEQVYKAGQLEEKELWEKEYKFALIGMLLAVKEMIHRDIKLEELEII